MDIDPKVVSLIIIGHENITDNSNKLNESYLKENVGVVSFDRNLETQQFSKQKDSVSWIVFSDVNHYVTSQHKLGDTIKMFGKLELLQNDSKDCLSLIKAGNQDLVWISKNKAGRWVQWANTQWMPTKVLGPLMGLDDCLLRSMIWAAKKPFVVRGLPPLVTMRVDDAAGLGYVKKQTPFYWVNVSAKYGFKPWLGLFIYNLNPEAINELRSYIEKGMATAAPHALGRPMRKEMMNQSYSKDDKNIFVNYYYNPKSIPLRASTYDEYLYFDHQKGKPWSDVEAERGLKAVDQWYIENQPLPSSKVFQRESHLTILYT